MTIANIRPAQIETDVPGITALLNKCEMQQPVTQESVRSSLEDNPPERMALHLVALDAQDGIIGYCHVFHPASAPDHYFSIRMAVDPAHRSSGIGSDLWGALLVYLRAQGATHLASEVMDTDAVSLVFAGRRGFTINRRCFISTLDLTTFDETPYLSTIADLEAQGICFCSLADFPDTPEIRRKFYELSFSVVKDIPGQNWDSTSYPAYFEEHIRGVPWFDSENHLLAIDGDTWVGLASVRLFPESQEAYNTTTGVIRGYRRRKIALALKVFAVRYARQHGARQIRTDNDSLNAPILQINQKLGYQSQPGKYWLVRRLEESAA